MAAEVDGERKVPCDVSVKLVRGSQAAGSRMTATITARAGSAKNAGSTDVGGKIGGNQRFASMGSSGGYSMQFNVDQCEDASGSPAQKNGKAGNNQLQGQSNAAELMGTDGKVKLSYIVCEVSGRWICDNVWVAQKAHSSNLELENPNRYGDVPWSGAMDDASHYGGGGQEGYSGFIFRSKPHVITETETIFCGSQIVFDVSCEFPEVIPPSLRGTAVRYSYALAVVASFDSCAPRSLRIPIRVVLPSSTPDRDQIIPVPYSPEPAVEASEYDPSYRPEEPLTLHSYVVSSLPPQDIDLALALSLNGRLTPYRSDNEIGGTEDLQSDQESLMMNFRPDNPGRRLSNPTVADEMNQLKIGESWRDVDSQLAAANTSPESLPVYLLKKGEKKIGRLFLPKTVHELGETLTAIFDFSEQEISCYRLSASLEVKEIVDVNCALGAKDKNPAGDEAGRTFRKVYGEHNEFVGQSLNTYLVLSIPRDAPVSFRTAAVAVKWQLVFAFYTPSDAQLLKEPQSSPDNEDSWFLLDKETDVLHWTLPIVITGPTNQIHSSRNHSHEATTSM